MNKAVELGGLPDSPACPHEELRPVWADRSTDTRGASGYWCEACGTPFTPTEAAILQVLTPPAA